MLQCSPCMWACYFLFAWARWQSCWMTLAGPRNMNMMQIVMWLLATFCDGAARGIYKHVWYMFSRARWQPCLTALAGRTNMEMVCTSFVRERACVLFCSAMVRMRVTMLRPRSVKVPCMRSLADTAPAGPSKIYVYFVRDRMLLHPAASILLSCSIDFLLLSRNLS